MSIECVFCVLLRVYYVHVNFPVRFVCVQCIILYVYIVLRERKYKFGFGVCGGMWDRGFGVVRMK